MADASPRPGTRQLEIGMTMFLGAPLMILIAAQAASLDGLGIFLGFAAVMVIVGMIGFVLVVAGAVTHWLSLDTLSPPESTQMRAEPLRRCLLIGVAALVLAACAPEPSVSPQHAGPETSRRLEIHLYDGIGIHGYTYAELSTFLDRLDPAARLATVTEADVERYRVHAATSGVDFVLGAAASERLRAQRPDARGVEYLFEEGPFLVFLDGRRLYGGLSYLEYGAAGLQHPVLHWAEEEQRIVLRVRAVQGPSAGTEADRQRIRAPGIEALFAAAGRIERVP